MNSIKLIKKNQFDDVLIVFSSRDMPKGKFTLYNQLVNIDFPANMIFINDYSNQYYLKGTPEFSNQLDFINYLFSLILKVKRKYGKIFLFGASMGGYAALKYGSLLQADSILAFGVESELGLTYGHSIHSLDKNQNISNSDISKLVYKSPKDIYIIHTLK